MRALDRHGRALGSLRLSVTDRCNLRCAYCMPEPDYAWLPKDRLLRFEELALLTRAFAALGVRRVRLTGGEPLLRAELPTLVRMLREVEGIEDLALTTNGLLLEAQAEALRTAGLGRVTVSLDTLDPARFAELTRRDEHAAVLRGIEAARAAGFPPLKLDTVVMRGVNDDELEALLERAAAWGAELRFIEYMDVGGATRWSRERVVSRREMLARIAARHGVPRPLEREGVAPAERFALPSGQVFGVIASMTEPFCATCDRARVTADGSLYTCLYGRAPHDLRAILRGPDGEARLVEALRAAWGARADRGAEERLGLEERRPLVHIGELRADPRLEMHTRGG